MAVDYEIVLEKFSGPLDLLLHLIQKQELDIHDIPIATVTEQYLSYLRAMEELSLDVASEFIVMAATLLAIKSRMLLPVSKVEEELEDEGDPREQLIEQLLEYQRCKQGALQLKELGLVQSQVFSREAMDISGFMPSDPPRVEGVSIWNLVDSLQKLLRRIPERERVAEIPGNVINVDEVMDLMLRKLHTLGSCSFYELLGSASTRQEIVTGFLALLELVKNGEAICIQLLPFGDIEIVCREEDNIADVIDSAP